MVFNQRLQNTVISPGKLTTLRSSGELSHPQKGKAMGFYTQVARGKGYKCISMDLEETTHCNTAELRKITVRSVAFEMGTLNLHKTH